VLAPPDLEKCDSVGVARTLTNSYALPMAELPKAQDAFTASLVNWGAG